MPRGQSDNSNLRALFRNSNNPLPPDEAQDKNPNEFLKRVLEEARIEDRGGSYTLSWTDCQDIEEIIHRYSQRDPLRKNYAWAIPNDRALDFIAAHSPIVEIGAGGGYWASLLRERGAKVFAYDKFPPSKEGRESYYSHKLWSSVEKGSFKAVENHPECTLMLCWPPGSAKIGFDFHALKNFQGRRVIYIGEYGGCTGSSAFHNLLSQEFALKEEITIPSFEGIRDQLYYFEKK